MVREAVNLLYFFVYKATCIYSTLRACKGPAKRARRLLPHALDSWDSDSTTSLDHSTVLDLEVEFQNLRVDEDT